MRVQDIIIVHRLQWIAVHVSVLVSVYLYVPDAMPCPVVLGAMLYDAPRDGLRCRMPPYNATWCFAMRRDVPQYSSRCAAICCDALHSSALPYSAPCDALQCHMALCDAT